MIDGKKCPKCNKTMKKIPTRKLDSCFIVEFYCDTCDESLTIYPDSDTIKTGTPKIY
jgi:ssDNA-binding Zn-finger/Zn-ribbon topoisomerase 1